MNDDRLRVVIHAADAESLARARSNAANLQADVADAEIEIVINAAAVAAAIRAPHATDAHLRVCENTLRNKDLTAPAEWLRVPAAITHLARRQQAGWAYVRA
ncbi:hypothetical protein SAOR_01255 [Salinisphaera orenii MK-B5]|uniref:Intracellular sulfur oxidation DsrE/DsrF family protein n=1 Tax=Salinisphaera orenii MK-B5 TaxID=856730 RepID=A0A423PY15_9GAMM|nr:hypothetical protein [Salinisphaera orenii]ROO30475.1 hypothetical protein SAOR_01255 [Salinisphaera orenii MK-B5]